MPAAEMVIGVLGRTFHARCSAYDLAGLRRSLTAPVWDWTAVPAAFATSSPLLKESP